MHEHINRLDSIKIKNVDSCEYAVKRIKNITYIWGYYLQIMYLVKNVYPEYVKNSRNSVLKTKLTT